MASIRLDAETATFQVEVREGRRVLVLTSLGSHDEAVLELPTRDPDRPPRRLALELEARADQTRAAARHDAHRGGLVFVARAPEDGHGGFTSGAC